jgi:hypothetical protein
MSSLPELISNPPPSSLPNTANPKSIPVQQNSNSYSSTLSRQSKRSDLKYIAGEKEAVWNQDAYLLLGLLCISTSSWTLDPNMPDASVLPTSARPAQISHPTGARPVRRSEKGRTPLPVPDHHHVKLELLCLTIPNNRRTRVEERRQEKKKTDLYAVLFSQREQGRGGPRPCLDEKKRQKFLHINCHIKSLTYV